MIMIIGIIAFVSLMLVITLEHLNYLNLIQIDFFEKPYFKRDLRPTKKTINSNAKFRKD